MRVHKRTRAKVAMTLKFQAVVLAVLPSRFSVPLTKTPLCADDPTESSSVWVLELDEISFEKTRANLIY